jgi:hypothetical protein
MFLFLLIKVKDLGGLNEKDDVDLSYVSLTYIVESTVNTYLWIKATANSKINKIKSTSVKILKIVILLIQRPIKIWPAVMFAANRTDNVIGRIVCLTVSIITINWDKGKGVLNGTKWLRKWLVFFNMLNITKEIHNGKAKLKVNIIWDLKVKT